MNEGMRVIPNRTGKLWVHEGEMLYDIAGIASGNLRLDTIVVAQGLPTEPEPLYADASYQSSIEISHCRSDETLDMIGSNASNSVIPYWTGPWPVLHFMVEHIISVTVSVIIIALIDLLGNTEIETCDMKAMGAEDFTSEEADDFTAEMQTSVMNSDQWATVLFFIGTVYLVLLGLAELTSNIPMALSATQYGLLCVAIGAAYMLFIAATIGSYRDSGVSEYEGALFLLGAGLSLLMCSAEGAVTLKGLKLGFLKMLDYFKKDMLKSKANYAYTGRCNAFLFLTTLILIVTTIAIFWAISNGMI